MQAHGKKGIHHKKKDSLAAQFGGELFACGPRPISWSGMYVNILHCMFIIQAEKSDVKVHDIFRFSAWETGSFTKREM